MQYIRLPVLPLGLTLFLVLSCTNGQDPSKTGGLPAVRSDTPTSATATSDTHNLRGAPVQGATFREETSFDVQDAQLTMKVGDVALLGVMSMRSQTTEDLEILEVGDGLVRKGRLNHVLDKSTTTIRSKLPDGTEPTEQTEDNGALRNVSMTLKQSRSVI